MAKLNFRSLLPNLEKIIVIDCHQFDHAAMMTLGDTLADQGIKLEISYKLARHSVVKTHNSTCTTGAEIWRWMLEKKNRVLKFDHIVRTLQDEPSGTLAPHLMKDINTLPSDRTEAAAQETLEMIIEFLVNGNGHVAPKFSDCDGPTFKFLDLLKRRMYGGDSEISKNDTGNELKLYQCSDDIHCDGVEYPGLFLSKIERKKDKDNKPMTCVACQYKNKVEDVWGLAEEGFNWIAIGQDSDSA